MSIKQGLILILGSLLVLTSCSLFSGRDSGSNETKIVDITIINGESETVYSVTIGKQAKIETYYKPGCYLMGFFDKENDGIKYFDTDGYSISYWDKEFPTVFYAIWDDLANLELLYTNTDIVEFSYSSATYKMPIDSVFLNGIKGNLAADLSLAIGCKIKAGSWTSYYTLAVKDQKDASGETFATTTISSLDQNNYKQYNLHLSAKARVGASGFIYVVLSPDVYNLNFTNYIKDLSIVATF